MATETVTPLSPKIAAALDSPEIETLIRGLDADCGMLPP